MVEFSVEVVGALVVYVKLSERVSSVSVLFWINTYMGCMVRSKGSNRFSAKTSKFEFHRHSQRCMARFISVLTTILLYRPRAQRRIASIQRHVGFNITIYVQHSRLYICTIFMGAMAMPLCLLEFGNTFPLPPCFSAHVTMTSSLVQPLMRLNLVENKSNLILHLYIPQ